MPGTGKTHAMCAIGHRLVESGRSILFIPAYRLVQDMLAAKRDLELPLTPPRLNARRFEELVVKKIRANIFTEDSIPDLVTAVDEEIDGMVAEDRKRVQTIEAEIRDVKRQLDRIWRYIATRDDVDVAKTSARMAEYQDRQERLEEAAAKAREVLARHRSALGDAGEIAEYAREMDDFLDRSEQTERRAFIESFVKEVVVMPGQALLRYTMPMPDDGPIPGGFAEKLPLDGSALGTKHIN